MKFLSVLAIATLFGLIFSSCAPSSRSVSESDKMEKIAQDKQSLLKGSTQLADNAGKEKALREEQGTSNNNSNSVPKVKSNANVIAKKLGTSNGVMTLPPNYKLVLLTWKKDSMWVLYRPMRKDEVPEEYIYQEDSTYGIMEGTIRIKESRE